MKIGDTLEAALWLSGGEPDWHIDLEKSEIQEGFRSVQAEHHVLLAPVTYYELRPGDDRVPDVPKHVDGPDVRLVVGETRVIAHTALPATGSFLFDIDRADLARLRDITRREHQRRRPRERALLDAECDALIEALGPVIAARMVKAAIDNATVH